jgi:catechol 2,3-dioxygenase-like lactoylglutathione lyase family enzyme
VPKKSRAKKSRKKLSARRTPSRPSHSEPSRVSAFKGGNGKLTFNHAMVYVRDVERSLRFYADMLGFKVIEDFRHENRPTYARLRAPGGDGTIALHQAGPGDSIASDGVRLYFEVPDLDNFCRKLQQKNFYFSKLPATMPWGWRHAYINDPDGHEISLYWAGENRLKKTMGRALERAARSQSRALPFRTHVT